MSDPCQVVGDGAGVWAIDRRTPTLSRGYDCDMIDESRARELAVGVIAHSGIQLGPVRELREGWFFPYHTQLGSHGVIINKRTGHTFELGSAFPVERDLMLYDRGWQANLHDLVILEVRDLRETRRAIGRLPLTTVEPKYEHGQVWRIPKTMTDLQRWARLEQLPCLFPAVPLYFHFEVLEEAREAGWFTFAALEYRPSKT